MIICFFCYVVDLYKFVEFEIYGKMWILFVEQFGGMYYGYFLLFEGVSNIVFVMFLFLSFVEYECYCECLKDDLVCQVVFCYVEEMCCIVSYECSFFWLVFE